MIQSEIAEQMNQKILDHDVSDKLSHSD